MSVAGSQQRTFLALVDALRPHWRRDRALPARLSSLLAGQRSFGSRDRRLYRELLYTTLRYLPWIEPWLDREAAFAAQAVAWLAAETKATQRYRAELTAGWPPCPPELDGRIRELEARAGGGPPLAAPLPAWFQTHCPEAFEPPQVDALLARAPLWLRLQTDEPARVTDELARRGWRWSFSELLPTALQVFDDVDVTATEAFAEGRFEVQDLGSQLLLESAGPAPGGRWLDACAGAGGKTLQLARLLGADGAVDAHDIRPAALRELAARAARAGRRNVTVLPGAPRGLYEGVLVDAPCSGSGTWRRAPHLKWTTTSSQIEEAAALQRRLLQQFSAHVQPGGRLIYATCSLSRHENEDVVRAFLEAAPAFAIEPAARAFGALERGGGLTLLPSLHNTDGFFVAAFRRRPA